MIVWRIMQKAYDSTQVLTAKLNTMKPRWFSFVLKCLLVSPSVMWITIHVFFSVVIFQLRGISLEKTISLWFSIKNGMGLLAIHSKSSFWSGTLVVRMLVVERWSSNGAALFFQPCWFTAVCWKSMNIDIVGPIWYLSFTFGFLRKNTKYLYFQTIYFSKVT
jgi:hypothetical protein